MNLKKILIIRFSSIGDIVLTTPVIRALKTQLDQVEIHFCTKKQYQDLVIHNTYVDKVHVLDNNISELVANLKKEKFDFIVDLHNNLRTLILKTRLGVPSKSFHKLNFQKWLMVNLKINRLPNIHIVDRYYETVLHLGVKKDRLGLDYFIPEKDEVEWSWLPETHRNGFVAYAIGGQHNTKILPVDKMIQLCDKINKPIILLGGKEDAPKGEEIVKFFKRNTSTDHLEPSLINLNKKAIIFNACGKFNLNQSASILKKSSYVFTHDTGLMHIAAAFKKEIFSIWGNTIPMFGMYPYQTKFTVFENNKLGCRPCSKIGYRKCPLKHFKCMNDQNFDFYLP